MKKLIGLFAVLFITTGVFGQNFIQGLSFIETTPTRNNTIEDHIRDVSTFSNGDYSWIHYVHFIANEKLYMLSYEPEENYYRPNDVKSRSVYLYSKDTCNIHDEWQKASEVVTTTTWLNRDEYCEIDFFTYDENKHNTSVGNVVMEGDTVVMTVGLMKAANGNHYRTEKMKLIFKPDGDKYILINDNNVGVNTAKNGAGYEVFNDDNISLSKVDEFRKQFLDGEKQIQYSRYSDHKYKFNFNAPCADKNRNFAPENITNGYQRLYFQNSENVYAQRKLVNNRIVEIIYFHPDGRIYTIKKIVNDEVEGRVKFVDLENYVILEGQYRNGKLVGKWNTPIMANFNVLDNNLINQYPGVVNQILTFTNFYYYDKDGRALKMNGFAP